MQTHRRSSLPDLLVPTLLATTFIVSILLVSSASWAGDVGPPTVLHVDRTDDDGSFDGCIDAVPLDCSLRGAISLANLFKEAVIIELPAGTFELTTNGSGEDLNVTGDLDIRRSMTIRGQGPQATILSGGETVTLDDRLIEVHSPNLMVTIESLAITDGAPLNALHSVFVGSTSSIQLTDCVLSGHGSTITGGGALRLAFGVAEAVLEDCEFSGNRAMDVGAAISSGAETLMVLSSTFVDNVSLDFGGALYLESTGQGPSSITIAGSLLQDNQSRRGGAVWAGGETALTIVDSTFRDNRADTVVEGLFNNSAGAIYTSSDLTITASTFAGNQADNDAAALVVETLAAPQGQLDVFNSTFSGNTGLSGNLPAIRIVGSAAEFLHVTFAGNDLDLSTDQADVALQNNAIDTACGFSLSTVQSNGGNVYPNVSCAADVDPTDLFAADLELGPLAPGGGPTWTHVPNPGSPLLGASPVCPGFDQRGFPRPGTDCASGSVERQPNEGEIFTDGFESGDTTAWSAVVN